MTRAHLKTAVELGSFFIADIDRILREASDAHINALGRDPDIQRLFELLHRYCAKAVRDNRAQETAWWEDGTLLGRPTYN